MAYLGLNSLFELGIWSLSCWCELEGKDKEVHGEAHGYTPSVFIENLDGSSFCSNVCIATVTNRLCRSHAAQAGSFSFGD